MNAYYDKVNDMIRTDDETLINAMEILSREIKSEDGVANAVIAEAAIRLRELVEIARTIQKTDEHLEKFMRGGEV